MVCVLATFLWVAQVQSGDRFPDTPKNHWAYEAAACMRSQGLVYGRLNDFLGRGTPPPVTRFSMAVYLDAGAYRINEFLSGLRKMSGQVASEPPGTKTAKDEADGLTQELEFMRGLLFQKSVGYLGRIQAEFAPEYKQLGVSPNALTNIAAQYRTTIVTFKVPEPGSALRQFPDVPAAHWAAKAVLDLRSQGILHGYPDGTFNGR